jgi:DNA polymerase III epsilon subunit-like protein
MRVLVFDTETTGLPQSKIISPDTLKLWPHIVQFSYVIYDTDANDIVVSSDDIVKVGKDVIISDGSIELHGITKEISQNKGKNINELIDVFCNHLKSVDVLVGHNIEFDIKMLKVELLRFIYSNTISDEKSIKYKNNLYDLSNFENIYCTMQKSIELCGIKKQDKFGKEYNKYPKLIELHQKLFNTSPDNLHNAFNDILITLRCYIKMNYDVDLLEKCEKFIEKTKHIQLT